MAQSVEKYLFKLKEKERHRKLSRRPRAASKNNIGKLTGKTISSIGGINDVDNLFHSSDSDTSSTRRSIGRAAPTSQIKSAVPNHRPPSPPTYESDSDSRSSGKLAATNSRNVKKLDSAYGSATKEKVSLRKYADNTTQYETPDLEENRSRNETHREMATQMSSGFQKATSKVQPRGITQNLSNAEVLYKNIVSARKSGEIYGNSAADSNVDSNLSRNTTVSWFPHKSPKETLDQYTKMISAQKSKPAIHKSGDHNGSITKKTLSVTPRAKANANLRRKLSFKNGLPRQSLEPDTTANQSRKTATNILFDVDANSVSPTEVIDDDVQITAENPNWNFISPRHDWKASVKKLKSGQKSREKSSTDDEAFTRPHEKRGSIKRKPIESHDSATDNIDYDSMGSRGRLKSKQRLSFSGRKRDPSGFKQPERVEPMARKNLSYSTSKKDKERHSSRASGVKMKRRSKKGLVLYSSSEDESSDDERTSTEHHLPLKPLYNNSSAVRKSNRKLHHRYTTLAERSIQVDDEYMEPAPVERSGKYDNRSRDEIRHSRRRDRSSRADYSSSDRDSEWSRQKSRVKSGRKSSMSNKSKRNISRGHTNNDYSDHDSTPPSQRRAEQRRKSIRKADLSKSKNESKRSTSHGREHDDYSDRDSTRPSGHRASNKKSKQPRNADSVPPRQHNLSHANSSKYSHHGSMHYYRDDIESEESASEQDTMVENTKRKATLSDQKRHKDREYTDSRMPPPKSKLSSVKKSKSYRDKKQRTSKKYSRDDDQGVSSALKEWLGSASDMAHQQSPIQLREQQDFYEMEPPKSMKINRRSQRRTVLHPYGSPSETDQQTANDSRDHPPLPKVNESSISYPVDRKSKLRPRKSVGPPASTPVKSLTLTKENVRDISTLEKAKDDIDYRSDSVMPDNDAAEPIISSSEDEDSRHLYPNTYSVKKRKPENQDNHNSEHDNTLTNNNDHPELDSQGPLEPRPHRGHANTRRSIHDRFESASDVYRNLSYRHLKSYHDMVDPRHYDEELQQDHPDEDSELDVGERRRNDSSKSRKHTTHNESSRAHSASRRDLTRNSRSRSRHETSELSKGRRETHDEPRSLVHTTAQTSGHEEEATDPTQSTKGRGRTKKLDSSRKRPAETSTSVPRKTPRKTTDVSENLEKGKKNVPRSKLKKKPTKSKKKNVVENNDGENDDDTLVASNEKPKRNVTKKSKKKNAGRKLDFKHLLRNELDVDVVIPNQSDHPQNLRRSKRIRTKPLTVGEGLIYEFVNGEKKVVGIQRRNGITPIDIDNCTEGKVIHAPGMVFDERVKPKREKKNTKKKEVQKRERNKKKTNVETKEKSTSNNISQSQNDDESSLVESQTVSLNTLQDTTFRIRNHTTSLREEVDATTLFCNDSGKFASYPEVIFNQGGVKITKGLKVLHFSEQNEGAGAMQGNIVIEPRSTKVERIVRKAHMCFVVFKGPIELYLEGTTITVPEKTYFQIPCGNRYSFYNPSKKRNAELFYTLLKLNE